MLHIEDLHKAYGATLALAGVDLEVPRGTILGLLGPNGAGKTSLVSIVAGLRRPDRGRVQVGGIDAVGSPQRVRQLIGLAPQDTGVYPTLTVRDNLRFFAGLAGLRRSEAADPRRRGRRRARARRRCSTGAARSSRAASAAASTPRSRSCTGRRSCCSTSRRRVPTSGHAPRSSSWCGASPTQGSAVVYSTHYLHEIEELDADVAFIDHGRIVARGTPRELVARYGSSALELTFERSCRTSCASTARSSTERPCASPRTIRPRSRRDSCPGSARDTDSLRSIEVVRPSLESVFLTVTGRRYDHANPDPGASAGVETVA